MDGGTALYRALVRLYPREFRGHYGDDLVQHFADLVERDGAAAAWHRTIVDLAVTIPRYRLESIMSPRRSTVVLFAVIAVFGLSAVATFAVGAYPIAVLLFLLAAAIAMAERSQLGRSLRSDPALDRRRPWVRCAASTVVAAAVVIVGLVDLGNEDHWPAGRLILYNTLFFVACLSALTYFIIGVRCPRAI